MIGAIDATDRQIFDYALANDFVIFTHDLDFGAILAHTRSKRPSVIQARVNDPLPDTLGTILCNALCQFSRELESGSLLTILPSKTRVRILPL